MGTYETRSKDGNDCRELASKLSFHLVDKMIPAEISKKGGDIIKLEFLSACRKNTGEV